jgi:hypothetical protein
MVYPIVFCKDEKKGIIETTKKLTQETLKKSNNLGVGTNNLSKDGFLI